MRSRSMEDALTQVLGDAGTDVIFYTLSMVHAEDGMNMALGRFPQAEKVLRQDAIWKVWLLQDFPDWLRDMQPGVRHPENVQLPPWIDAGGQQPFKRYYLWVNLLVMRASRHILSEITLHDRSLTSKLADTRARLYLESVHTVVMTHTFAGVTSVVRHPAVDFFPSVIRTNMDNSVSCLGMSRLQIALTLADGVEDEIYEFIDNYLNPNAARFRVRDALEQLFVYWFYQGVWRNRPAVEQLLPQGVHPDVRNQVDKALVSEYDTYGDLEFTNEEYYDFKLQNEHECASTDDYKAEYLMGSDGQAAKFFEPRAYGLYLAEYKDQIRKETAGLLVEERVARLAADRLQSDFESSLADLFDKYPDRANDEYDGHRNILYDFFSNESLEDVISDCDFDLVMPEIFPRGDEEYDADRAARKLQGLTRGEPRALGDRFLIYLGDQL